MELIRSVSQGAPRGPSVLNIKSSQKNKPYSSKIINIYIARISKRTHFYSRCPAGRGPQNVKISVCVSVLSLQFLSKRPSSFCLIHFKGISGASRGHLGGSSGAAQGWKPTFDGRRPLMEDELRWKTTFDGRRLMMEDDL